MQHKSLGYKMKPSETIFCLVLLMMRNVIRKVYTLFTIILSFTKYITHPYLVIYQCGLERDLTLFDAGDKTEVGEKGLTLRYVPNQLHI